MLVGSIRTEHSNTTKNTNNGYLLLYRTKKSQQIKGKHYQNKGLHKFTYSLFLTTSSHMHHEAGVEEFPIRADIVPLIQKTERKKQS